MLSKIKKEKLTLALKGYCKKYMQSGITDLDESGTRIMINAFLTEVLGYASLEEVKTEYMIKGTYADYMVQIGGTRHFLVEVKALSIALSDKHLRQAINYGANEGVEWALLTNGKCFEFYKIIFAKPIESKKVFSIDLSVPDIKNQVEQIQYLHRDSVINKGLDALWNNNQALDVHNIAGILRSDLVISIVKKHLRKKFEAKFEDSDVEAAIKEVICNSINIENVKTVKIKPKKKVVQISSQKPVQSEEDLKEAAE